MSRPSAPILRNAPRASPNTLEFYWITPTSNGGSPITGYQLVLNPGGLTCNIPVPLPTPSNYYKVTGLTNAVGYQATIAATNDGTNYGDVANFRELQPGSKPPQRTTSATLTALGTSNALIQWSPPAVLPDATIFWYVIQSRSTNPADPVLKVTADGTIQSNYFFSGLNSNSIYDFNIRPVNGPGYGPSNLTNTIQFPTPFTPSNISGLQLQIWFDAVDPFANGSGVGDNTIINTWFDKSGNARNAPVQDLNAFRYRNDGTGNGILFAANSRYNIPETSLSNAVARQYFTEFIVQRLREDTGGEQVMVGSWGGTSAGSISMRYEQANAGVIEFGFNYNDLKVSMPNWNASPQNRILSASFLPQNRHVYLYGVSRGSDTNNFPVIGWKEPAIGGGYGGNYYRGYISEILLYTGLVTPFLRQKIEGYLAWKWGLTGNLPTSHPFRNVQPTTAGFVPTAFPNLQFWIDASDLTTITLNSGNVSQWNDKSGNGYHLTQSTTANQPPYNATVGASNVQFLNDDYMNIPQGAINNASQYTLYFVFTPIATTNWIFVKQWDGNNTYNALSMTRYNTASANTAGTSQLLYFRSLNSGTLANSTSVLNAQPQIITMRYDGTNLVLYRNGAQLSSTAGTFAIQNITGVTNFTLGAWILNTVIQNSGVTNFTLNEMLFYNTSLADPDRQTVEGYLGWKWGLTNYFFFSQPYKFSNPMAPVTRAVTPAGLTVLLNAKEYLGTGQWLNTGSLGGSANANNNAGTIAKSADGAGIVLNGSTTYIVPPTGTIDLNSFEPTAIQGYTISVWFKRTASIGPGQSIVRCFTSGTSIAFDITRFQFDADSEFRVLITSGTTTRQGVKYSFPLNTWVNFCIVNNGSVIATYVNGDLLGNAPTSGLPAVGGGMFVGYNGTSNIIAGGEIGQILYNSRALTRAQVKSNYEATFTGYN
jgi:hypothetical protein